MGVLRCHNLLGLAQIAAAMILGGGQARAAYVSPAELAQCDGVNPLVPPAEKEGPADMAGAGGTSQLPLDTDEPQAPSELFSALSRLPFLFRNLAQGSMSGESSGSASGNSSSSSLAGYLPGLQVPPLEFTCLLPPPTGAVHPFFLPSSIFRPPRAA